MAEDDPNGSGGSPSRRHWYSPPDPGGSDLLTQLLAQYPDLANQLAGGAGGPLIGNTLAEALMGSAMDVTGRYGTTGQAYGGALPEWATGLASPIYDSPDFDPFLGVVSQPGDERVYFGEAKDQHLPPAPPNKFASELDPAYQPGTAQTIDGGDRTKTVTQAMNMPYLWDDQEVSDAMKRMKDAGFQVSSFDDLVSTWGALVNRAAMTYSLSEGRRQITPWDALDLYKDEAKAAGIWTGNGDRTTVQRNVTDITEGEAFASLQSNLSQMLGRDPSDQETRDYLYRMNRLAAENPSVSRTVTSYKDGVATSSSTHTDPGFTSDDMAQEAYDQAQNEPDYAEYRGASYLFNAAMGALGPIAG